MKTQRVFLASLKESVWISGNQHSLKINDTCFISLTDSDKKRLIQQNFTKLMCDSKKKHKHKHEFVFLGKESFSENGTAFNYFAKTFKIKVDERLGHSVQATPKEQLFMYDITVKQDSEYFPIEKHVLKYFKKDKNNRKRIWHLMDKTVFFQCEHCNDTRFYCTFIGQNLVMFHYQMQEKPITLQTIPVINRALLFFGNETIKKILTFGKLSATHLPEYINMNDIYSIISKYVLDFHYEQFCLHFFPN